MRCHKSLILVSVGLLLGGVAFTVLHPTLTYAGMFPQVSPTPTFSQRVIELINQERASAGLPPLKESDALNQAAQAHSQAMADGDFFDHTDLGTGSTPGDRVTAVGYIWTSIAENIGLGYDSPRAAVEGWMESEEHRANILDPGFREVGVGYVYDADDTYACGDLPCYHYWTQDFGTREDVYPLVINGEAFSTDSPEVNLYIYGQDWAHEMRFSNDGGPFSEWEPFSSTRAWTLPASEGEHTVTVELRNGSTVLSSSDTIYLLLAEAADAQHPPVQTTPTPPAAGLPPAVPGVLSISRAIDPLFLAPGQEAQVTIQVSGANLAECLGAPARPLDVMLVYDISSSAGSGPGSNWEQTLHLTQALIDQLTQPIYRSRTAAAERSRLGLITSQTAVTGPVPLLLQDLTQDYALARAAIESVVPGGDTDVAAGVRMAADVLSQQPPDRAQAIVLMLHDNVAIDESTIAAVADARGRGGRIYLVANSLNIAPEKQVTPDVAAALVEPGNFFANPQPQELRRLFVAAAEGDPNRAATDVRIVDAYSPAGMVEVSNLSGPGGRVEGDRAVWDIPAVAKGETVVLTYKVRLRPGAQGPVQIVGGVAYIDCNGYLYNTIAGEQMEVAPAPTPTPVEVPMVTPTPTPVYLPPPGPTAPPAPLVTPMPPPSLPRQILGGTPCTQWYLYLIPLLLPLLLLLLLWLLSRFLLGIRSWRYEWEQRKWKCRLPILLLLLYLLFVAFLGGRVLSGYLCGLQMAAATPGTAPGIGVSPLPTPARLSMLGTPLPPITSTTGLRSSQNVALVDPYYFMPRPRAYNFTDILVGDISTATLASFDTLVLSQVCDVGTALSTSQKQAIVDWVGAGGKFIIYDSDVCGGYSFLATGVPLVDYSWLPYPFVTDNPGGRGSSSGHFTVVVNDTMVSNDPTSPYYIDAAAIDLTEIGDANVMITQDPHWCGDAMARNVNNQQGFVHAYAFHGNGLIIYNGLDTDDIYDPALAKLWEQELAQPWDPTGGQRPPTLTCQARVYGGPVICPPFLQQLLPTPMTGVPLWPWLLPLLPLLLLIWLLCRRRKPPVFRRWEKRPRGEPGPIPSWTPAVTWDPGAALIIGLGGSGRWVLTHLKKSLLDAGSGRWPEQVRLLLLDTTEDELIGGRQVPVTFAGVELAPEEKLAIAQNLSELTRRMYEDPTAEFEMRGWYPARDYQEHVPAADLDLARGTHQRRPLGRAGVFRHLHERGDRSALYQRLVDGLRAVKEPLEDVERAHVIIVGSLAGGMGSAALCDIVYLVRRAAAEAGVEGSVSIEGFLIAEGAFRAITTDEMPRVNTFAALREIGRFQLSRGRPYPMIYRLDAPEGSVQNDYSHRGLFDSLYVLDWAGFLSGERPEHGIFPATADMLTVMLDRASRARDNALQPFRDRARGTATRAQALRGEAIMGTFGHQAYRLPFTDIVERLKVRFAEDLLREYLVGPGYKGGALVLRKEQNREEIWGGDLHTEVMRVLGVYWYPAPAGPPPAVVGGALGFLAGLFVGAIAAVTTLAGWWLWVGMAAGTLIGAGIGAWIGRRRRRPPGQELYLALPDGALPEAAVAAAVTHATTTEQARNLIRPYLADVTSDAPKAYIQTRQEAFRRYLLEVVAYILNGRAESGTIEARTGKLGYALAFLDDLRETLNTGAGQVQFLSAGFTGSEKQKVETFHQMASALMAVVDEVKADLEAQARALTGQRESEPGVYYHLLKRRWELDEHRKEMDAVQVRRYLWTRRAEREGQMVDEDLVTGYYRDYVADQVEPSLEQFHWRIVEEDGQPRLRLYFRLEEYVPLEESALEPFATALQELGGRLVKELWERKGEALAEIMAGDQLTDTNLPTITQTMHERSIPLASHDPQQAVAPPPGAVAISAQLYQAKAFLYVNQNVARREDLAEALRRRMEGVPVEILPATDPFTCSLLQLREVIPLSAFDFYGQSESAYRTTHGIAERGRRAPELGWREPPHVFPAERNALLIEQRLPEIEEVPWPFHPLFVPALEDLDRARAFALALLNGYVRREGGTRYRYRLQLPGERVDLALGWPEDVVKPEAQLVVAMRTFVLGQPAGKRDEPEKAGPAVPGLAEETLPGPYEVARLAKQVRRELERHREQLLQRLEALEKARFVVRLEERRRALAQALPPYLREEADRPGGRELIAFLRLVAKDEYQTWRRKAEQSWEVVNDRHRRQSD